MNNLLLWLDETMLIERCFGILAYVLLVFIAYLLLRTAKTHITVNITLNIALLVLGIMAFFFIPDPSKDLYRWLTIAEDWRYMSLADFMQAHVRSSSTPIAYLLIYFCSKTGISGLLPMVCALVFYSNVFHIFKDVYLRLQPSNKTFSLSFLFFMAAGAFLEVISGVRCFVALSIVARCIYDEFYADKKILTRLPFYLCACLLHTSAIPVFIFRMFYYTFIQKKKSPAQILISVLITTVVAVGACLFASRFINNMFEVAYDYLFGEKYSYFWEHLIGLIQWFTMAYTLYFLRGEYSDAKDGVKELEKFLRLFLIVNLFLIFEYNLFHRFLVISAILFIPYLAGIKFDRFTFKHHVLCQRVFALSILIFSLVCVRGNLCGYKFLLL